ncbi:ATP-binding protein [uncultured Clostridium sp.]|uniref:sensor histidine kinase n=1 Tax=uncultured Clostridium sp. TaxID=59620 RepID=UPI0025E9EA92|nr:ATP-binding protein [uncultured Clostridium sp.]
MRNLYRLGYIKEIGDVLKSIINGQEISLKEKNTYTDNAILSIMIDIAVNHGVKVNISENSDLSLCKINEIELYQVLNNIFSNAIRALSSQKQKIINIRINKCKEQLVIEIENNGPKIDEETKTKIFQTGFTTKKNEESSHGYGLSIVKELVENNNGSIEVKSTVLLTNFKIMLPCK